MAAKKQKSVMGRPSIPVEQRRRRLLSVRMTDTELGVCLGAAQEAGESLADWARRVLTRG